VKGSPDKTQENVWNGQIWKSVIKIARTAKIKKCQFIQTKVHQ